MPDDDDYYPDDDLPEDDDDLMYEDCGMGPDGQCSMAGSEWCDWSCSVSARLAQARIAAMKAKDKCRAGGGR